MPILKHKDLYDDSKSAFENLLLDLEKANERIVKLTESGKKLAASLSAVKKSNDGKEAKKLAENTQSLTKTTTELTAVQKQRLQIKKQLSTVLAKNITANEKSNQVLAKGKLRLQENNKLLKQNAREALGLVGAYEKLAKKTLDAQKKFKNLAAEFGENSKQAKKAKLEFQKLDNELTKVNRSARDGKPKVGSYGAAMQRVGAQLVGALGLTGLMTGVVNVFRNATKIFTKFEKRSSKLAAILGETKDGISSLTEQAKELGSTTAFTASEVIDLQTELAKLGFTQTQIEASTESILSLAAATGSELAESAELAGATLRIFNLDASEMSTVTDVLAKSTTISSLSMEKLATIMPTVGKTAQLAGVSLQRTAALAGTLTDRGLDASTAATSLRNIFQELSNKGLTWNEAMEQINSSTDKNKTAMDIFGKRAAAAASIIAETADSTDDLTTALENSTGAAQEMADVMLDNLAGDITIAQSTWEGFVLSLEDGNGIISRGLRLLTQGFTNLFEQLKMLNTQQSGATGVQKDYIGFNRELNQVWSELTSTYNLLTSEEHKRHEALILSRKIFGELEKSQKKLNIAQKAGLPQAELDKLAVQVQFNQELVKRIKPLIAAKEKVNELEADNTKITESNNKSKRTKIDLLRDEEKLLRQITDTEIELLNEGERKERIKAEEDFKRAKTDIENSLANKKTKDTAIEALERQHQQRLSEIKKEFAIEALKPKGEEDPFAALDEQLEKEAEMKKEARLKELEAEREHANGVKMIKQTALQEGVQFASEIFAFEQDRRLQSVLNETEAEKKILQEKLDKNEISEAQYRKGIDKLNKKARNAEAKAEKRKALFDIGVATAVGVVKALPNYILAAAVGITGAIQAAFVAAKPLPKFAKGTESVKLGSNPKGVDTIPAMVNEGERIVPTELNKKLGNISNDELVSNVNRGLIKTNKFSSLTPSQQDGLTASLLMQGNKQNKQIIQALSNLFGSYENDGFVYIQRGDGSKQKIVKI